MSVSIRLKRFGTKKRPYYRVVVMDSREATKGRPLEEIGQYRPIEDEKNQVEINNERAAYWLSVGAQPSNTVKGLFAKQGIQVAKEVPVKD
ncbi:MAG: 30S ribosomal protein S16 [Sphaerochaetaceae bacterium]|nr:30S ribosomal protein S16 [Sphaerochaetaceae bacterium]